jgi:HD superfamily phosphodiesterase
MFPPVITRDPAAVENAVREIFLTLFPKADAQFVPRIFDWAGDVFGGRYGDYQPIDARYHDLEHTLQGALCMARLLQCRHAAQAIPALPQRTVELGLIAILFHDTGYLKTRDDLVGTGAKFTVTHVDRSCEFAAKFLAEKNFLAREIVSVQHMIRCTGVDAALGHLQFQDEAERVTGHILGTADLLGQMAADDYVDKLPVLFAEFAEAAAFTKGKPSFILMFNSAADLLKKTPAFWDNYVKLKLTRDFSGQFRYLNQPQPDGNNHYLERIESNMARVRQQLAADTSHFRKV